ncbi:hypothetical protein [Bacillus arachidis]|uniref:Lipoprotein n=1 Tax=Bacillus arachidis TaxID=2819290 RepID=A0ABS3P5Y9_9BACI|nr:hypothetical protein [Bacillus arachidis]MBO1628611.1 hypothetical protein [Bacillus arachidis]
MKLKIFFISLLVILSIACVFFVQKKDVIFQEGNPIPFAIAMSKMILTDKNIMEVQTEDTPYTHLVKQGELEPYIEMREKNGWEFLERDIYGNSLTFQKGNMTESVPYRYFTRYYTIIDSQYE